MLAVGDQAMLRPSQAFTRISLLILAFSGIGYSGNWDDPPEDDEPKVGSWDEPPEPKDDDRSGSAFLGSISPQRKRDDAGGRVITSNGFTVASVAAHTIGTEDKGLFKPGSTKFSFFSIADWGGKYGEASPEEKELARALVRVARKVNPECIIVAGDNFYEEGVTSVDDPQFKKTFEEVFTAPELAGLPWFVVAGDHDHHGRVDAQVSYSKTYKKTNQFPRWIMPSLYHDKVIDTGVRNANDDDTVKLHIIGIDTMVLGGKVGCPGGNSPHNCDSKTDATDSVDMSEANAQYDWLENTLRSSTADFIVVFGHFPVWSMGEHGPTPYLRKRLVPLLQQYKVAAYISGHEHEMQVFKDGPKDATVMYIVTGTGDRCTDTRKKSQLPATTTLVFDHEMPYRCDGFMAGTISPKGLDFHFYVSEGELLHTTPLGPIPPRNI